MPEEAMSDRLQQLWEQGNKHIVVAFLRRALSADSTLAEVAATLQFDAVRNFTAQIRLREVVGAGAAAARPAKAAAAAAGGAAAAAPSAAAPGRRGRATKKKRTRRGPKEMQEIKDFVLGMLRREGASLDTNRIEEGLGQEGHRMDRITLNRMLSSLEQEGHLRCLGGRPKAWKAAGEQAREDVA